MKIDIQEAIDVIDGVAKACFLRAEKNQAVGDLSRAMACKLAGCMVRLSKVILCEKHGIVPGDAEPPAVDMGSIFGPSRIKEDEEDSE